ncbi:MAG: hypothetical protein IJ659_09800 [Alloprevotella sp.]|nr:hypothetical protein [Alloprevotella sp.]MBR1595048.1 hypothetical protein [Alloprevotella sp.]
METNTENKAPRTEKKPAKVRTEKQQNLIALRNWVLSLLGIAIVVGIAWVLLASDGTTEPVEVRPYDMADSTDADVEATVDWIGVSSGTPQADTAEPERPAETAAPKQEETEEATEGEGDEVSVETITPAPAPATPAAPAAPASTEDAN